MITNGNVQPATLTQEEQTRFNEAVHDHER